MISELMYFELSQDDQREKYLRTRKLAPREQVLHVLLAGVPVLLIPFLTRVEEFPLKLMMMFAGIPLLAVFYAYRSVCDIRTGFPKWGKFNLGLSVFMGLAWFALPIWDLATRVDK